MTASYAGYKAGMDDERDDVGDRLRRAYEAGFAAAQRGEEAAPGCTADDEGRAFLAGYVEGAGARRPADID